MPGEAEVKPFFLPGEGNPDYFRALVQDCIAAYEKLSNDSLALDFCKIADRKLRALILDDSEYRAETRSIFARQRMEEVEEMAHLQSLTAHEEDEDDGGDDHYELRDGKKPKKAPAVDKDIINIRFKAAQMKRELRSELAASQGDHERDAVNLMFVPITREEFEKLITIELYEGTDDAGIDALIGTKEDVPVGTREAVESKTELPFDILPDGTVVER